MTKKQLTALITVLCSAMSMTAQSALAIYTPTTWEYLNDGSKILHVRTGYGMLDGFVVETDGTVLTADMVNTLDGFVDLTKWSEYEALTPVGSWLENSIVPDENDYMISTESMSADQLLALGRSLMLELECIESIYLVEYECISIGKLPKSYVVTPISEDIVLDKDTIPELAEFSIGNTSSVVNYYSYTLESESQSELYTIFYNEDVSGYERYQCWDEYAKMIMENHSDILKSVETVVLTPGGSTNENYTATSIWQTAGDPNSDGTVDAQDAAALLETAAQAGTGAKITVTSAADVNADGAVGADDAAAVLTYAAANGSGNPLSWVEVLRK